jgi:hypothetical protein
MCQLQSTQTPSGTHPAIFQMGAGQLQHLDQAAENDFIERMMEHIYELFPDETKNIAREQARSAISTWTKEARHWELLDEPDVERWIELCICHSEIRHAAETPWVIEILAYPGRSAAHKLERLQQRLIFLEA